jgi:hypothetical protein
VALTGSFMGYWMFGPRGSALFAAIGVSVSLVFRLVSLLRPGLVAGLGLVLAAALFHSASTLGWGAADAPDGTRYKASPVGLSHVLTPRQPVSKTTDCGWHGAAGYPTPCAVADEQAFRQLRSVYPLVLFAALLCGLGAVMSLRLRWRLHVSQRLIAACAAFAGLLGVVLFARSIDRALAPLAGLSVGVGGTLGTMQLTAAVLLCFVVWVSPRPTRLAPSSIPGVHC